MSHLPKDEENKVLRIKADEFVLDNYGDRRNSHTNISTRGELGENDVYLQKSNLYLDNLASIGFNGTAVLSNGDIKTYNISNRFSNNVCISFTDSDTINFNNKLITGLQPKGISAASIASPNYSGEDLDHELDALATSITAVNATKLNSTGYTVNRMVITSGAGNITTGDAITDFVTETSTSTLQNKSMADITVPSSNFYLINDSTASTGVSTLIEPGKSLRFHQWSNNNTNNKDGMLTMISNNKYDIYTNTNVGGTDEVAQYFAGHISRFTHGGNWLNTGLRVGGTATSTPTDELEVLGVGNPTIRVEATGTDTGAYLYLKSAGTGTSQIWFSNKLYFTDDTDGIIGQIYRTSDNDIDLILGSDNTTDGVDRYVKLSFANDNTKWIVTGNNSGTGANKGFMAIGVETSGAASIPPAILIGVGKVAIGNAPTYPETHELEVNGDCSVTGEIMALGNTIKRSGENAWISTDETTTTISENLTVVGATSQFGSTTTDNTTVDILASDTTRAELRCMGASQGTGRVFVGQQPKWGGGIEYNGDNSPESTGAGADYFTLFRRDNNTDSWTAKNYYNSNDWYFRAAILPNTDNSQDLGSSSKRWDDIYATNSSIQISDERMKKDISECRLGLDFINKLKPVSYKWKNNGKRTHYGLIAQEVGTVLTDSDISFNDFAGYIYSEFQDEGTGNDIDEIERSKREYNDAYGLRYIEFISPMIKAVQELSKDNKELAQKHETLNKDYQELAQKHETLNTDYQELKPKHETLNKDYQELKVRFETLNTDYQDLKMRFERDIKEEQTRNAELEIRLSKLETLCCSIMNKIS